MQLFALGGVAGDSEFDSKNDSRYCRRVRRLVLLSGLVLSAVVGLTAAGCSGTNSTSGGSSGTAWTRGTSLEGLVSAPVAPSGPRLRVVVTTPVLADFARHVGGPGVDVVTILKPNVDPHDFEPSPADIDALASADVIVQNGVGLEKWFAKTIANAKPRGSVIDASTGITLRTVVTDGTSEDDPHIWHDPHNAEVMVSTIADAFTAANPSGRPAYTANADTYKKVLGLLDAQIASQIDTLANKKLVTNHDAFGYYVARYGLDFVGSVIPSFDSSAELSAKAVDELATKIRDQGVKAVFSESALSPKSAAALADAAGVRIVQGDDALYGDSLGPPGSDAATYIDMMMHNTEVIVDNLR